jgi:phosphatidate cytidylyltransferase
MTGKPPSDLTTRFAAAVAMIAVAVAAIWLGGWAFRALAAAAGIVMLLEWCAIHSIDRRWAWVGAAGILAASFGLMEFLFPAGMETSWDDPGEIGAVWLDPVWRGFGAILAFGLLIGLVGRRVTLGWGFLYITVPIFALLVLRWTWEPLVFWLMLVTWSTDIFAYFAGRSIGGPRLAPRISPNKTWAGLVGGMAGAAIVGALAAHLFGIGAPFIYLGAPMGLIAQIGDLYESSVKRRYGIKDSGSILPGHGGVLDRLDGLLPVVVATLLVLVATLAAT